MAVTTNNELRQGQRHVKSTGVTQGNAIIFYVHPTDTVVVAGKATSGSPSNGVQIKSAVGVPEGITSLSGDIYDDGTAITTSEFISNSLTPGITAVAVEILDAGVTWTFEIRVVSNEDVSS